MIRLLTFIVCMLLPMFGVANEIYNALDAEAAITQFLHDQNSEKQWKVIIEQPNWALHVTSKPTVQRIDIARTHDRFDAWLALENGQLQRLSGKLVPVISVPVLTHAINPGDIIQETDIAIEPIRSDQMGPNIIVSKERLLGQTARHRLLKPYTPILLSEIAPPKVIRRGAEVSLTLRTKHIVLTQRRAQALEDGAVGDRIKVCNLDSKRVVMGVVKDGSTVEIHHG